MPFTLLLWDGNSTAHLALKLTCAFKNNGRQAPFSMCSALWVA
jgi:hypothetical protein